MASFIYQLTQRKFNSHGTMCKALTHTHTPSNKEPVMGRLIKIVTLAVKLTFCPHFFPQVGNLGVQSSLGEAIYVYLSDKQYYRLSLMRIVQRLFNDSFQNSVVGVAEIIALGLAKGKGTNNDRKSPRVSRATLKLKW